MEGSILSLTCVHCEDTFHEMSVLNKHMQTIHEARYYLFDITRSEAHPRKMLEDLSSHLSSKTITTRNKQVVLSDKQAYSNSIILDQAIDKFTAWENVDILIEVLSKYVEQQTDPKYTVLREAFQLFADTKQHGKSEKKKVKSKLLPVNKRNSSSDRPEKVKSYSSNTIKDPVFDNNQETSIYNTKDVDVNITLGDSVDYLDPNDRPTTDTQSVSDTVAFLKYSSKRRMVEKPNIDTQSLPAIQATLPVYQPMDYSQPRFDQSDEAIDLSQRKAKEAPRQYALSYFMGEMAFDSFKISRPYYSVWEKCGKGDNSTVKTAGTYKIPSGLPLPNEQRPIETKVPPDRTGDEHLQKESINKKFENTSKSLQINRDDNIYSQIQTVSRRVTLFRCKICGKTFTNKPNYEGHLNRHRGINPFICEVCGQLFSSSHILRRHKLVRHKPKNEWMSCHVCKEKTFPTRHKLREHMKYCSLQDYSFRCKKCHKAFKHLRSLTMHQTVHTGQEYGCEICAKKFHSKSGYLHHKRTHFNQYQCSICRRIFSYEASLHRHMKTHQEKKAHLCHVCERTFIQKTSYWIHMLKHHDLTKDELIVMFPEKHLPRNLHHTLPVITETAHLEDGEH